MKTLYKDCNGDIYDAQVIEVNQHFIILKYGNMARVRAPFEDLMLSEITEVKQIETTHDL